MTEQELRALVREALSRYVSGTPGMSGASLSHRPVEAALHRRPVPPAPSHSSHGMFVLPVGADADGPCIIEPAVSCNHCGYCTSYGH